MGILVRAQRFGTSAELDDQEGYGFGPIHGQGGGRWAKSPAEMSEGRPMAALALGSGTPNSLPQRYDHGLVRIEVKSTRRPRPAIADWLVRGK